MDIAILGFGSQGKSAVRYWNKEASSITVCDVNENIELPSGVTAKLGPDHLSGLDEFDLIVRSPIVHPRDIVETNSETILGKVTTVTNEFFRVCPTKNIIGVTGTKGKGTTSSLIARMLEVDGKRVHLGGNIGIPPLDLLKNDITPDDWVVLELANFQLIDLKYSPHITICLMVVPEHLDWHPDTQEYYAAKKQLFKWQKREDIAIYYAKNPASRGIAEASTGQKIPYYAPPGAIVENDDIVIDNQSICSTDEIRLPGKHNWQNVCAAVTAAWQITKDTDAIRSAITAFTGLEHRLQLVKEVNGVKYYDDSFGTTPETAIVAIQAFEEPKIVILGGSDKGADFDDLAQTVADSNVKKVILIGTTGPKIKESLDKTGFQNYVLGKETMKDIVEKAKELAEPGDVVLLSTGCASFGMFKNYKDRGEQFTKAVLELS